MYYLGNRQIRNVAVNIDMVVGKTPLNDNTAIRKCLP